MSRFVALVRVLPVALALSGLTAADLGLPSNTFWNDKHAWLYACLVVAFFVSAASQSLMMLSLRTDAERVRRFETETSAAMAAALQAVSKLLNVDIDRIGVHIFLVSGISLNGRWRLGRLVLVGRLRVGARPGMHRPRWSIGKGVVGRAWQRNAYIAEDWESVYQRGQAMGQQQWDIQSPDLRYYMSWTELFETHGYQLIAARPVHALNNAPAQIIGCVAIDAQVPLPATHVGLQLVLSDLARVVEGLDRPPRMWLNQRKHGY